MKKILKIFVFCACLISSKAFCNDAIFVKIDAVKSVWPEYYGIQEKTTLDTLFIYCLAEKNVSDISECREQVKQIVEKHNELVDATPVSTTVNPTMPAAVPTVPVAVPIVPTAETSGNISSITIKIDLDGGTPVSGNCANEIVVKSGTSVTLDCDAVKNEKHLSGYVDNYGIKKTKNWQYGFQGAPQIENISLKAEYDGDNAVKVSTNNDGFATQESCLRQAQKTSDNGINCKYNSDSKKWVFDYVIHDGDVCTCVSSSNAHKNAKTCKYRMMLNHFECVADTCVDGFKTNSYHMCEQEIANDEKTEIQKRADKLKQLNQQRLDNRKEKIRHLRRNPGSEFTDKELKLYDEANVYAGSVAKREIGNKAILRMYDCDENTNKCGFTFVDETSGKNALACCRNIKNSGATCSVPYTWQKGDTEHTSVSDCR
jgi:hypothetical protein